MPKCPKCEDENPQLGAKCPRDGFYYVYDSAYEQAQSDPRIGTMSVDKYVIIGRISKGGMGAVYCAMQLPVEREVAFKVLRTEMEGSDKSRDRFIREARAVSKLTHPNIITLYDFGFDENNHPYMAMEYAPGQDLSKWLQRDDLTVERVLHVIRQLLGALDAAHIQGIVHRDLKPENMIVTETSRDRDFVKLLDFGIARMINETSTRGLTREGEVFGTPHYMAPEQAQGAKEVGPAADVYAVGIMLYELITGITPFDAPTPLAVLLMHINEPLPQIVPRQGITMINGLDAFVRRAASKNEGERFAHAGEMLEALDLLITQSGLHSTGAFMGVAMPESSGDLSPAYAPQMTPISNAESHAPTLTTTPLPAHAQTPSDYNNVSIDDPDPSEMFHQSDLIHDTSPPADLSDDLHVAASSSSSNKKVFIALAAVLFLVVLAGGTIAVLTSGPDDDRKTSQETQDTLTSQGEIAQKEMTTPSTDKKEPLVEDKPLVAPPIVEPVVDPALKDLPADPLTEPAAKDDPPLEEKPVIVDKTPVIKKTPPQKQVKTTPKEEPKEEPKKEPKEEPKKEPKKEPVKDTWGAPTKEQKENFKKNDKW